jgi:hypothetical protein
MGNYFSDEHNTSKYYLSEKLNGNLIKDIIYSAEFNSLNDNILITKFILGMTYNCHGYILFKTNDDESYMCHLAGIPGDLNIIIQKDSWNKYIQATQNVEGIKRCYKTIKEFKEHFQVLMKNFGPYDSKNNNCRHFSLAVADFLELKIKSELF